MSRIIQKPIVLCALLASYLTCHDEYVLAVDNDKAIEPGNVRSSRRAEERLPLATAAAKVAQATYEERLMANNLLPGSVSQAELARLRLARDVAQLDARIAKVQELETTIPRLDMMAAAAKNRLRVAQLKYRSTEDPKLQSLVTESEERLKLLRATREFLQKKSETQRFALAELERERAAKNAELAAVKYQDASDLNERVPGSVSSLRVEVLQLDSEIARLQAQRAELQLREAAEITSKGGNP